MKCMSLDEKSDNYNSYYNSSSIISKLAHIKWCWVLWWNIILHFLFLYPVWFPVSQRPKEMLRHSFETKSLGFNIFMSIDITII